MIDNLQAADNRRLSELVMLRAEMEQQDRRWTSRYEEQGACPDACAVLFLGAYDDVWQQVGVLVWPSMFQAVRDDGVLLVSASAGGVLSSTQDTLAATSAELDATKVRSGKRLVRFASHPVCVCVHACALCPASSVYVFVCVCICVCMCCVCMCCVCMCCVCMCCVCMCVHVCALCTASSVCARAR
jgi:hypothetical protein